MPAGGGYGAATSPMSSYAAAALLGHGAFPTSSQAASTSTASLDQASALQQKKSLFVSRSFSFSLAPTVSYCILLEPIGTY